MSKQLDRRSFLRAAPAASAAVAVEAQRAAQQVAVAATQGPLGQDYGMPVAAGANPYLKARKHIINLFKSGKVPKEKLRSLERQARAASILLDADIECLVSVPYARKRAMQKDRNIKRLIADEIAAHEEDTWFLSVMKNFGAEDQW